MPSRVLMPLLVSLSLGCASSELPVPSHHPANHQASTASLPEIADLRSDFEASAAAPADPAGHSHDHAAGMAADEAAAVYTCPMHPEIVRSEPGTCPICGMKLVPKKEKK